MQSSVPYILGTEVSRLNATSDYHSEIPKYSRNVNQVMIYLLTSDSTH